MSHPPSTLLAVDWGTSSLRGARLDAQGHVLEEKSLPRGIQTVEPGEFATVFEATFGDWARASGSFCLISGMAGSKQGWVEATYCPCPAGFDEVAARLMWIADAPQGPPNARIAIVPGLSCEHPSAAAGLTHIPDVMRGEEVLARGDALNDVVLNSGVSARMIEFDLYIEEQFVYTQRSDGLIISTPTGSTAYSLSGGGPIMHPGLDALVLVPMFPHTLGSRPLVIHGNSSVRIVINEYNDLHPNISCDGQLNFRASPGDVIHIHKKPERLQLLHPLEHNFYAICRAKLGWGSGPGD